MWFGFLRPKIVKNETLKTQVTFGLSLVQFDSIRSLSHCSIRCFDFWGDNRSQWYVTLCRQILFVFRIFPKSYPITGKDCPISDPITIYPTWSRAYRDEGLELEAFGEFWFNLESCKKIKQQFVYLACNNRLHNGIPRRVGQLELIILLGGF